MQNKYGNIIINYSKETKTIGKKISKEIKRFVTKYDKLLVLQNQKVIEINLIISDKLEITEIKRMINVKIFSRVNTNELTTIILNKILIILEKDNVFVPEYLKEQINNCFNIKKKIKLNEVETNKIIEEINKSK